MKTQMNATTLVAMIKEVNSHVKPSEIQALTIDTTDKAVTVSTYTSHAQLAYTLANARVQPLETGTITVDYKQANKLLKLIKEGLITISADDEKTSLATADTNFTLTDKPYSSMDKGTQQGSITVATKDLVTALKQAKHSLNKQDSSPVLTAYHISLQDGQLTIVATDSHTLSKHVIDANGQDFDVVVRGADLVKALSGAKLSDTLTITDYTNCIEITDMNHKFLIATIDVNYPDIERIIPTQNSTTISLDTKQLTKATKYDKALEADYACLTVAETGITLTDDKHSFTTTLDSSYDGETVDIAINPTLLLEALETITEDHVCIKCGGSLRPIVISGSNEFDHLEVVCPTRRF